MWSWFYEYNTIVSDFPKFLGNKRMRKQYISDSLFPPPTEGLGTRLVLGCIQTLLNDKKPRCYKKSPTAQDMFQTIPGLISCAGVTMQEMGSA